MRSTPDLRRCSPVITVGCPHSGTRAVVEILGSMGVLSGPIDNPWLEHEAFLDIHESLMHQEFGRDAWNEAETIEQHSRPDVSLDKLSNELLARVRSENSSTRWQWKNPRASLFLPTWQREFPEALFIWIRRPAEMVAAGLVRANTRSTIPSLAYAERLRAAYHQVIERDLPERSMVVDYVNLTNDIPRIARELGITSQHLIETAMGRLRSTS